MRWALGEQREVLDSMTRDFSRFTTWTVTGLSRMMDQAGARIKPISLSIQSILDLVVKEIDEVGEVSIIWNSCSLNLLGESTEQNTRGVSLIMEYLVKISKKARILELKRRHLKITVLTSYTPKNHAHAESSHLKTYTSSSTQIRKKFPHLFSEPVPSSGVAT
ncbi:hypothetical protein Tco_0692658 [Tanacetum coccineum]